MPVNKNASFRYRVLDQCLRNRYRTYKLEDLVEEVSEALRQHFGHFSGVSKRTIQADLNILRSMPPRGYGADIVCESGVYRYVNPSFSIQNAPLNADDLRALEEIGALMKQFDFLPFHGMIRELHGKLMLKQVDRQQSTVIQFEMNKFLKGLGWILEIYPAIRQNQKLEIGYQPFHESESIALIAQPYLLKEYNNRWFLVCESSHREGITILSLDRINTLHVTAEFFETPVIDWDGNFGQLIGVSVPPGAKAEQIILEISSSRIPYLETKPLHHSQQIVRKPEKNFVYFQAIVNHELKAEILSLLPDVIVAAPESLVIEFRNILGEALEKHHNVPNRYV